MRACNNLQVAFNIASIMLLHTQHTVSRDMARLSQAPPPSSSRRPTAVEPAAGGAQPPSVASSPRTSVVGSGAAPGATTSRSARAVRTLAIALIFCDVLVPLIIAVQIYTSLSAGGRSSSFQGVEPDQRFNLLDYALSLAQLVLLLFALWYSWLPLRPLRPLCCGAAGEADAVVPALSRQNSVDARVGRAFVRPHGHHKTLSTASVDTVGSQTSDGNSDGSAPAAALALTIVPPPERNGSGSVATAASATAAPQPTADEEAEPTESRLLADSGRARGESQTTAGSGRELTPSTTTRSLAPERAVAADAAGPPDGALGADQTQ